MSVQTGTRVSDDSGVESMSNFLIVEKEAQITWLKLNRPDVANSLNRELLRAIMAACRQIKDDKDTRVVIITAAGAKTFCAGADLAERKGMSPNEVIDYLSLIQAAFRAVEELPQPTVAAINGNACGGGTELTLACDLRMMVEEASLRLTEVKLGIIPGAGGTQRLPRLIGKSRAKELILTARPVGAREALEFGLIHRMVPAGTAGDTPLHQELMREARSWAKEIATAAPLSLRQAKWAIDNGYDRDLESGLALETKAYLQLLNTKDRLEGLAAFAEKREPVYCGE